MCSQPNSARDRPRLGFGYNSGVCTKLQTRGRMNEPIT